jgi:hypothetical protein
MKIKQLPNRLKLVKFIITAIVLFIPQTQFANAVTKKINYNLLVGEWSLVGRCSKERYIYTSNNKYVWMQKKGAAWKVSYQGIFMSNSSKNTVVIADGLNMGGNVIDIFELNKKTFRGKWNVEASDGLSFDNPEDAKFTYVRCSGQVFK